MESVNPSSTTQDLLGDLDEIVVLNYATKGQRFANYFIDRILAYGFAILVAATLGAVIGLSGGTGEGVFEGLPLYILMYGSYLAYYTLIEGLTKGRSVGKLITRTQAVTFDGQPITFKLALLRSLCRIVPFEAISGLGSVPWHDRWTETTVINK